MKILFCHNYYQQRGGEDQCFEDDVDLLEANGHEVVSYIKHNDDINTANLLSVAKKALWNSDAADEVSQLIRQHRPDVVHIVNTFPLLSPSVFYAAREANIPVVLSIHNYRAFCAQAMCFRNGSACEDCLGRLPWRAVVHRCYRNSLAGSAVVAGLQMLHRRWRTLHDQPDLICLLSEFSKSKYIAAGFDPQQLTIKRNYVSPDPGERSGGGGYAVFAGRLVAEKGLAELLAAWRMLDRDIPLKILGEGPEGELAAAAAREMPHVEWLGRVPLDQVYDVLGDAACLVFPSTGYESLPKTLLESLAVGTPVLGSDIGSIGEVVLEGRTGRLFEVGNPAAIAETVRQFFDHDDQPRMRRECRELYETLYTADANYQALIEVYEEAIRRRRGDAASHASAPDELVEAR